MLKKNNEKGRSMVEMLGVIAIIGVLSVAALAGYSRAVEKNKVNRLKEQINSISSNLIIKFQGEKSFAALGTTNEEGTLMAKKLGVIPPEMIQADGSVRHAFNGNLYVRAVDYGGEENAAFTIDFDGLPQKVAIELGIDGTNLTNDNLMYLQLDTENENEEE